MTYEEFWRGDPWLAKYYREAYVERRKEENRRDWLQGAYIYNAVATAIGNAFRKKGAKTANYVEEPFQIFPLSEAEARAKMEKEKQQAEAAMMNMMAKQRAEKARRKKRDAEVRNARTGDSPKEPNIDSRSERPCGSPVEPCESGGSGGETGQDI